MIAPILMNPSTSPSRRPSISTAREATRRRKAAQVKRRYQDCVNIGMISAAIVLCVVGYLVLITRSTALDDRLIGAQAKRAQLQEDLVMLEDRRASLEARDRLSQIAVKIGYKEHPALLIVDVPAAVTTQSNSSPFLGAMAGWLHLR
jgi:hypothetical protein